ncbi:MAG: menaquinone biosynthesis decarboxylase [Chloroflexi bacterium]|nr:menaquinone biosynthesis decarboxylase [Chloroflexota bacterium]
MAFRDLRAFIKLLEQRGQLRRIAAPVSCDLEITEITDRVSKARRGNVALLFENVEGYRVPVLINTFGSPERMAWALGVDHLDHLGERVARLLDLDIPASFLEKLKKLGELSELARFAPRLVEDAPCQEVVETHAPSLDWLPIMQCWPDDGGRYITLPLVITRDPRHWRRRNVGMYRLQVYDDRTLGMHWQIHKGGAEHHRERERQHADRMEVAIALGADPATLYAGSCPLPPIVDEFVFSGWLRRERLDLVKCKTVDLEVPAHAEIVLEGYVDPAERRLEGPFGDHTGYYSLPDQYPVFHLTAITHRRHPIYPSIIVGRPPMEDDWLGKATERLFLPIIRMIHPEIVDMDMPFEGIFHNLLIVSMRKSYPGQARKVMYGIWGLGLMILTKAIIVVDEDVNVHDYHEVTWRVCNNVDPRRDMVVVDGPLDALDHAADQFAYGAKVGIDATRKGPLDGFTRPWPDDITMSPEITAKVDAKWRSLGLEIE